jgi:hypothetical protein
VAVVNQQIWIGRRSCPARGAAARAIRFRTTGEIDGA